MDIRQLHYFIAVAEHLNFTEAAKKLYVAQPAVSQQIASLEKKIGVKLFHRTKHSVELTNAGRAFLEDAREIAKRFADSIQHAREAEEGLAGVIRIGLLSVSVRDFLPLVVRSFRSKYPNIRLHFSFHNSARINRMLQDDEIDIAFTLSHGLHNIHNLQCRALWNQPYSIILPQDHALADQAELSVAQLEHEPFLMLDREESPQGYDYVLAMCASHGFSPRIVSHASRPDAVLMMVDAGIGITILSRHLLLYASPRLRFVDIAGEQHQVDVVVAWKNSTANPSVPLLIREVEDTLATASFR
ncbi:LysR family transcriptional regulator [Brevibacillus sp. TJ4]|uniref:LysR family transcriptional regulator n=1 Tax=Brevibacillus sp. TJ4 TaxID=3234853 RepID=UPI0037CCCD65